MSGGEWGMQLNHTSKKVTKIFNFLCQVYYNMNKHYIFGISHLTFYNLKLLNFFDLQNLIKKYMYDQFDTPNNFLFVIFISSISVNIKQKKQQTQCKDIYVNMHSCCVCVNKIKTSENRCYAQKYDYSMPTCRNVSRFGRM